MISFSKVFSLLAKLGGVGLAAYGTDVHSVENMTVGAAVAVAVHFIDSVFNSPKGDHPTP